MAINSMARGIEDELYERLRYTTHDNGSRLRCLLSQYVDYASIRHQICAIRSHWQEMERESLWDIILDKSHISTDNMVIDYLVNVNIVVDIVRRFFSYFIYLYSLSSIENVVNQGVESTMASDIMSQLKRGKDEDPTCEIVCQYIQSRIDILSASLKFDFLSTSFVP